MTAYADFLATKQPRPTASGLEPLAVRSELFDFQEAIVRWAVRRGRAAIFADTGLGKTRMQVEWAHQVLSQVGGIGLIVAPLAVAEQTIAEAAGQGITVDFAQETPTEPGLWITNYEKLHRFEPDGLTAVVLDESSILKSTDGKTRTKLLREWTDVPYRLCCTATPAPNDISELANHGEFLGVMSRAEMLAAYFVHEEGADWRLKGHAEERFYAWMATWAVYIRQPSDLGFSDEGFALPPLEINQVTVVAEFAPADGRLMPQLASGIEGRRLARTGSLAERVAATAAMVKESPGQWLIWCGLNAEQDAIVKSLGSECVSIEGATLEAEKLRREQAWRRGDVRVLVTKLSIFGHGLNWQNCHQMAFLGLGDSWEQYYQGIRRCWRFGQRESVTVRVVVSEPEGDVVTNVWRKERTALATAAAVVEHMREAERVEVLGLERRTEDYREDVAEGEGWRLMLGDSCERMKEIETGSVGLSVHSPPFASLYTYSPLDRDLGNSSTYPQFFEHYRFIIGELLRATMPGRRAAVHVQQVTTTKVTHGVIGWRDFRADVVAAYQGQGWIYDGEVVIDKDPQAQAIRTKSKQLMFATLKRDSSWLRPAMADYILLFRAPGDNAVAIHPDISNEDWIRWARPIWYGIRESETLQASAARTEKDEKHIAPLQLETVERCVRLWSNEDDLVCDPFAGIGTTGFVALQKDRRFVGIELKPEYWRQAAINLRDARAQLSLFDMAAGQS